MLKEKRERLFDEQFNLNEDINEIELREFCTEVSELTGMQCITAENQVYSDIIEPLYKSAYDSKHR